jgi:hypothetical protein
MPMWNCSALAAPRTSATAGMAPISRTRCALQAYGQCWLPLVQQLMGIDRRNCEAFVAKRWQNFLRTQPPNYLES